MNHTYAARKQSRVQPRQNEDVRSSVPSPGFPMSALRDHIASLQSGVAAPGAADKGRRTDLPEAMRTKMENSFGMDFSSVKLYESEMVGAAGAEAVARGNEIAFAPGKLDFSSRSGQALLGHELSHVASQAREGIHANGFLLDGGLEARADREGAMAADGRRNQIQADHMDGSKLEQSWDVIQDNLSRKKKD